MTQKRVPAVTQNLPFVAKVPSFKELHVVLAFPNPTGTQAMCFLHPNEFQLYAYAPVSAVSRQCKLEQRCRSGWRRDFSITRGSDDTDSLLWLPIILSAGEHWTLDRGHIKITGQACIVDGARRIEASLNSADFSKRLVTAVVYFGLNEAQELSLRGSVCQASNSTDQEVEGHKVETNTLRLEIDASWTRFRIESDPYVVKTALGYTAAINVRVKDGTLKHVLCGSKSLAVALEEMRLSNGSLVGLDVEVRKESSEQRAPYQLRVLSEEN